MWRLPPRASTKVPVEVPPISHSFLDLHQLIRRKITLTTALLKANSFASGAGEMH